MINEKYIIFNYYHYMISKNINKYENYIFVY